MYAFKTEMEALNKTVHETKNIIDKVCYVSSKKGHEEELEYWTTVRRTSNIVIYTLAAKISRLDTLLTKMQICLALDLRLQPPGKKR